MWPGERGWLFWHLAGVDPKLLVLKSAANFVEEVLWLSDLGLEDHNFDQRSLHQMFSIFAYLASNNMLGRHQVLNFLLWFFREGLENQLSLMIQAKSIGLRISIEAILKAIVGFGTTDHREVPHILNLLISTRTLDLSNRLGGRLLHSLARSDNVSAAKLLVSYGADVNFVEKSTYAEGRSDTPLFVAARANRIDMMKYLISAGSDVNKRLGEQSAQTIETALTITIQCGYSQAARLLLDRGAEVDIHLTIRGHNILEFARANLPIVYPVLIQKLARENIPRMCQMIDAAEKDNRTLSRFLLNYKIVQEEVLEDALCFAIKMENLGAVKTLLHRGTDPDARRYRLIHNIIKGTNSFEKNLPILLAAACPDVEMAQNLVYLLMKAGADLNDDVLTTICRLLANTRNTSASRVLADAGLNITLVGPGILEYLASDGYCELYALGHYLDMGAPINVCGPRGRSCLQAAAGQGDLLLAQYLVDRGADINLPPADDGGRTALQAAVESGYIKVIEYLIAAGAVVQTPPANRDGVTVLEAAASVNIWHGASEVDGLEQEDIFASMFETLLALGAPVNRAGGLSSDVLHQLMCRSRNRFVKLAIQAGARIEDRDFSRGTKTPLQAAAGRNIEAIQLLLDLGADINALPGDEYGRTALQAATSCHNPDPIIVKYLLSRGAKINDIPARRGGVTALQGAAISGNIQIARMLLTHGADIDAAPASEEGRTPIEGAAEHGRLDMVQLLLASGIKADLVTGFSRAIELAEGNEHFVLAGLLREHETTLYSVLPEMDYSLFGLPSQLLPSEEMVFVP